MKVNIREATTHLSRLIAAAEAGEEVVIARAGKPAVRLVPCEPERLPRTPGNVKIWIADDFDELPEDIAAAFGADRP